MEFKIFVVTVACFSCLVPDVQGAPFLAKEPAIGKGLALAKGALALKGAAIGKGVMLAKGAVAGALAAKGALIAKGVMAAKGVLAGKKAFLTKGVKIARDAVSALVNRGAAAIAANAAAASKGAILVAQTKSKALLAAKGALGGAVLSAGGAVLSKLGALSKPADAVSVPFALPALVPVGSTVPRFGRRPLSINELFYQAAEHPEVLSPAAEAAGVAGRIAGWAGAIQNAMVKQRNTAADLVGAMASRGDLETAPSPVAYRTLRTAPRYYPSARR